MERKWEALPDARDWEIQQLNERVEELQRACVGAIRYLGMVKDPDAHRAEVLLRAALNKEEKK